MKPAIRLVDPTFAEQLDAVAELRREMTPKTGANLVGVDKYEQPQNALYLIDHYDTAALAREAQAKRAESQPDEETRIYTPS